MPGTVTELRVHGVGGSTPEQVLNSGPARLVAGDQEAGFYVADDARVEAYCWGNLTSGGATRALWLLMLPFTLVNASFWMGPRRRANEALVRLLALSLTATGVLAAQGVGTDLIGWQCAARADCRERHTWLRFLGSDSFTAPGRRVLVGALVPMLVLGLLWVLARRTARHERVRPVGAGGSAPLEDPTFWYGARQVDRLRQLHLSVGLAVIGLGMAWPLWDWDSGHGTALQVVDAVVVGLLWAVIVAASVAVCLPSVVRRDPPGTDGVRWTKWVQVLSAVLVVGAAAGAVIPKRVEWLGHQAPTLPGYATAVTAVFVAQIAGVLVLVVLRHRVPGAAARGLAQPVFGALGLLFASLLSAGLAFRVADWLDGGTNPTGGPLRVPVAYEWAAVALVAVALPIVAVLGWRVGVRFVAARRAERVRVTGDYPPPHPAEQVEVVARTRALAGLTDAVVGWTAGLTTVCLAAAVVAMTLTLVTGDAPDRVADTSGVLRLATLSGTWLVSGFTALLLVLGYRSYRTASLRKTVGILWDLGTFWPRAAHPLAPPCYAERCIPDLTVRVAHHAPGGVVLSAHSQGSVLAAALLWQLSPEVLDRVRLVTYGSPVARLYGEMYTTWFGPVCVQQLQERLGPGRWVNLWRRTDPIGGPVGTEADLELPHDPPTLERPEGDPAYPKAHGHFDYEQTDDYQLALARLAATL